MNCEPAPVEAWLSPGSPAHRSIMPKLSRRRFVAASAASAAAGVALPAWSAPSVPDVDVAVIGAGAAGIAAARRIAGAKAKLAVLEGADRIGGRCLTDTTTFGVL
jgi:malic enzyme